MQLSLLSVESKLHFYYLSGLSLPGYAAFSLVSTLKAALLLREWVELAGVYNLNFGQ